MEGSTDRTFSEVQQRMLQWREAERTTGLLQQCFDDVLCGFVALARGEIGTCELRGLTLETIAMYGQAMFSAGKVTDHA